MPAYQGRESQLFIQREGESVYSQICGIQEVTYNREQSEAEISNHCSEGHREFLPDWSAGTISGSGIWEEDDDGQAELETAYEDKEVASFQFYMADGAGLNLYTCDGFVTDLSPSGPNEGAGTFSYSIRLSGKPVKTAQTT